MQTVPSDSSWDGVQHVHGRMPARNEKRFMLKVEVIPQNGIQIGYQWVPTGGPHNVIVYRSQLDDVKKYMRTPDEDAAEKASVDLYEEQLADFLRKHPPDPRLTKEEARRLAEANPSFEGREGPYAMLYKHPKYRAGIGTVRVLEVVEELPEPPTEQNIRDNQMDRLANVFVEALTRMGPGQGLSLDALDALIEKRVAERIAERKGNKQNG